MTEPVRTCVGCGAKAAQRELVRLVASGERVAVDRAKRGGRGAWLHAAPACLAALSALAGEEMSWNEQR